MYYIDQLLCPYLYFGTDTWQQECELEPPVLVSPDDSENVCPSGSITPGMTGVTVEWEAVTGADFYILQIALHGEFYGPGFKSFSIAAPDTTYEFTADDIRYSEEVHWRVWAYSSSGCTAQKSESRSFAYNCEQPAAGGGGGGGGNPGPGDQGRQFGVGDNLCERYAVKVTIEGEDDMLCCDLNDWFGKIAYNCTDGVGNDLITLNDTSWLVVVEPGGTGKITSTPFFDRLVISASCHVSQKIKISFVGEFTEIATGETFFCAHTKRVTINCHTKPKDKPWLQGSPYMPPTQTIVDSSDPVPTADSKTVVMVGPVFVADQVGMSSYDYNLDCCQPFFTSSTFYDTTLEAFPSFGLGCGLVNDYGSGGVGVDASALAGPGLTATDSEYNCYLEVKYGCGLYMNNDKLEVDINDLFGWGFVSESGPGCPDIDLYLGCGLQFSDVWDNPPGQLKGIHAVELDLAAIAGNYLWVDPEYCKIHAYPPGTNYVDLTIYQDAFPYSLGCGIGSDGSQIFIEPVDIFDDGFVSTGTCSVSLYLGCGLEFGSSAPDDPNLGTIKPVQLDLGIFGAGLYVDAEYCMVHAYASDSSDPGFTGIGCGLEIYDGDLKFDAWTVAANGIEPIDPDGDNCQLQFMPGCGLTFDMMSPRTFTNAALADKVLYPVKVDPEALAGAGLLAGGYPNCDLSVNPGCGIVVEDNAVSVSLGIGNEVPSIYVEVVPVQDSYYNSCAIEWFADMGICTPNAGEFALIGIYNGELVCIPALYCSGC